MNSSEFLEIYNKTCVIIPTYNNDKTLGNIISRVLNHTKNIIVINDGSTDSTEKVLSEFNQIIIFNQSVNQGKGVALIKGFEIAREKGFEYAITIDSDGQHFPEDIPKFIQNIEKEGEALLIGSRKLNQQGIPKGSNFGNKFSSFWYKVETGISLSDTQSGFRLYPIKQIPRKFYSTKFEFEIEIIVRSAWKGIKVKNIPIQILYDKEERVSHFRPIKDFARISILNTVLVLVLLVYIIPRNFIQKFLKKDIKTFFFEDILHSSDSNYKKSLSISLGVFIGIAPFWGFQSVLAIFLAKIFRLNPFISFAFSNVSIPPFIPFIVLASLKTGGIILNKKLDYSSFDFSSLENFKQNSYQYLLGSFSFAIITSVIFGLLSYVLLKYFTSKKSFA